MMIHLLRFIRNDLGVTKEGKGQIPQSQSSFAWTIHALLSYALIVSLFDAHYFGLIESEDLQAIEVPPHKIVFYA